MENLTKKPFDFTTANDFLGKYIGSEEPGHVFEDANGICHYIAKTVHTDMAVKAIEPGAVCKIVKTPQGHDVFLLDALEVEAIFKKKDNEKPE